MSKRKFFAVIEVSDSEDEIVLIEHGKREPDLIVIDLCDSDDEVEKEDRNKNEKKEEEEINNRTSKTEAPSSEISNEDTAETDNVLNQSPEFFDAKDANEFQTQKSIRSESPDLCEIPPAPHSSLVRSDSPDASATESHNIIDNVPTRNDTEAGDEPLLAYGRKSEDNSSSTIVGNAFSYPELPVIKIATSIFEKIGLEEETKDPNENVGGTIEILGAIPEDVENALQYLTFNQTTHPTASSGIYETPKNMQKAKRKRTNAKVPRTNTNTRNLMSLMGIGNNVGDTSEVNDTNDNAPVTTVSPPKKQRKRRKEGDYVNLNPHQFRFSFDECISFDHLDAGPPSDVPAITLDLLMKPPEVASLRVPKRKKQYKPKILPTLIVKPLSQHPVSSSPLLESVPPTRECDRPLSR